MKKIAFVFTLITTILLGSNRLVAQTTVISAEKKTNLSMTIPPTIIYKAAKKYADLVPITLSEDKQIIVSYPDPRDISERSKPTYLTKIYIGQFSSLAKAQEMQATINASGVNVNTVIKEVNGYYTIQAGVFSNYEAAKRLADQLNNAGFSAKIVKEIK